MNDAPQPAARNFGRLAARQLPALLREHLGAEVIAIAEASETASAGFPGIRPDLRVDIRLDGRPETLLLELKARFGRGAVERARAVGAAYPNALVALVVPHLGAAASRQLRDEGINHIDLAGTVFLRGHGLRIDVRGSGRGPRLSTTQHINPFSKKASLVLRALFACRAEAVSVTEIAIRTGLTKSWVSTVGHELKARGYVGTGEVGLRLTDPVAALHDWMLAYDWTRNERLGFSVPFDHGELLSELPRALKGCRWASTLLTGAECLAPHVRHAGQVHAYVAPEDWEPALGRLSQVLHAEPSDGGALQLLRPYYSDAALFDVRTSSSLPVVSPVQLVLDLARFPLRGGEAATMVVRTLLARELALTPAQVQALTADL